MNITEKINTIKKLSDEELEDFFQKKIQELEKDSEKDMIGYQVDLNPSSSFLLHSEEKDDDIALSCLSNGFIPIGSKIVYGVTQDKGKYVNKGMYYYVDTYDYILEFLKEMKTKDIKNIYEFYITIEEFILSYFHGRIDYETRPNLHKVFHKDEETFYSPIKEHVFSEFKERGGALCTEYTLIAQNILSFFEIETLYVIGMLTVEGFVPQWHAFNFVKYSEEKYQLDALVDFSRFVDIKDIYGRVEGYAPYIQEIDNINTDFLINFIRQQVTVVGEDYHEMSFENIVLRAYHPQKREYKIENKLLELKK